MEVENAFILFTLLFYLIRVVSVVAQAIIVRRTHHREWKQISSLFIMYTKQ